jgi:hypothetical protein
MGSYRVCARYIWDEICAEARRNGLVSDANLVSWLPGSGDEAVPES